MANAALILAFVAFTLVIIAISFGGAKMHDYGRRIGKLEEMLQVKPHTKAARTHRDIGEAFLFDFVRLRDELKIAIEFAEYQARRAAHVANGGRPDDPPTMWKDHDDNSPKPKSKNNGK